METDSTDGCSEDEDMDMVDFHTARYHSGESLKEDEYDVILISRRGRYRAGKKIVQCSQSHLFVYHILLQIIIP